MVFNVNPFGFDCFFILQYSYDSVQMFYGGLFQHDFLNVSQMWYDPWFDGRFVCKFR
jgi:hypothetical protein